MLSLLNSLLQLGLSDCLMRNFIFRESCRKWHILMIFICWVLIELCFANCFLRGAGLVELISGKRSQFFSQNEIHPETPDTSRVYHSQGKIIANSVRSAPKTWKLIIKILLLRYKIALSGQPHPFSSTFSPVYFIIHFQLFATFGCLHKIILKASKYARPNCDEMVNTVARISPLFFLLFSYFAYFINDLGHSTIFIIGLERSNLLALACSSCIILFPGIWSP